MKTRSLSRIRFLLYVCAVSYGLTFWSVPPVDPDLGWHLLGGEWTTIHRAVPTTDFINLFGSTWHDYHWLAQLLMWWTFSAGGFHGLMWAFGLLMAGVCASLVFIADRVMRGKLLGVGTILTILCAVLAVEGVASHRPQMIALVALAVAVGMLVRMRQTGEIAALFIGTALISNMHVYWVFIPLLWLVYRILSVRTEEQRRYGLTGLLVLCSAPLLSPYGVFGRDFSLLGIFQNYIVLIDYLFTPQILTSTLLEFRSSLADSGSPRWLLLGSLLIAAREWGRGPRLARRGDLYLFLLGVLLAVSKVKFIALFGVFSMPLMLRLLPRVVRSFAKRGRVVSYSATTVALSIFAGATLVFAYLNRPTYSYEPSTLAIMYPIDACDHIAKDDSLAKLSRPIRVLASFDHGGWCRWSMNRTAPSLDARVMADGRTQGQGGEYYKQLFDLFALKGAWLSTLSLWRPDFAVVSKDTALAQFMALAGNAWSLEYQDGNFALFRARRDDLGVNGNSSGK